MTQRILYEITCHEGAWAVSRNGRVVAFFQGRERAVRFADLVARRHYQNDGQPAAVSLHDGRAAVDIALHGETDPAANALAWIRHVNALRRCAGRSGRTDSAEQSARRSA